MAKYNTVVIKIGSSTLTTSKGTLDIANLSRIAAEAAKLVKKKIKVLIVTSAAIVSGSQKLGLKGKPSSIPQKQAAAAVGQATLMRQYEKAFERSKINVAQILLTRHEIENQNRAENVRNCIFTLLKEGVVPIINENDAVAVDEIKYGDNDTLSAMVATLIDADLLILLTDVDGFYVKDEKGKAVLINMIEEISEEIEKSAGASASMVGTGGMATKLQAAKIASRSGITTIIAHGRKKGLLEKIMQGKNVGTLINQKG